MKKTKRKAVINLIIFFLLLAGGIYMAIAGVGKNESGKTANVPLGLDLQGGLSVTYEIQDEKPSKDEIAATVDKLQRRVDEYSSEGEVKVDAHDVLDQLGQPGQLLFLDSENYTIWQNNQNNGTDDAYEAVLTGSDIKNAQAGVDDSGTVKDYVVQLQFTEDGASKFATATAANIGKPIYIIYDGKVASAPTVQNAITDGNAVINKISDYDEAEKLCLEKANAENTWHYRSGDPEDWNNMLYDIYKIANNTEKQIAQAKKLLLMGNGKFWEVLKQIYKECGAWNENYESLLDELKDSKRTVCYRSVLISENEKKRLLEDVMENPYDLFYYGKYLIKEYPEQVYELCYKEISESCAQTKDRREYKKITKNIAQLIKWKGNDTAKLLIEELKQRYPRKTALLDELEKVEKKL